MKRTARRARHIEQLDGYESGADAHLRATEAALAAAETARVVVLVEGISDQIAVDSLLARSGRDATAERIVVVPIGGAHGVAKFVDEFVGRGDVAVFGLCDEAEADFFADAFGSHALDSFSVCVPDLEAELIRSFDQDELESIIEHQGELRSLRTMQKQTGWRDRHFAEQAHRWIRSRALRSSRYAALLIDAAEEQRLPQPLVELVAGI